MIATWGNNFPNSLSYYPLYEPTFADYDALWSYNQVLGLIVPSVWKLT